MSGESSTIKEASKDFYHHLAAREQKATEARMALEETVRKRKFIVKDTEYIRTTVFAGMMQ